MKQQVVVVMLVVMLLSMSIAMGETMLSAIDAEYRAGQITLDQMLLYKAYSAFEQNLLPERFQNLTPSRCGTLVAAEIYDNLDAVAQPAREALLRIMARPTGLDQSYSTTHFKLHYTLTGINFVANVAYVQSMGTKFEAAYTALVTNRHYLAPPSDGTAGGDANYDVYIMHLDDGVMGYSQPEYGGPQTWNDAISFIAMRNNYTGYGIASNLIDETSAHEFFHAVQFAYDYGEQPAFMEISSVWIEDELYPTYDDEQDYLDAFFSDPDISLNTYDGWHEYGCYHLATMLSETRGDTIIKRIWEENRYASWTNSMQTVLLADFPSGTP